MKSGRGVKIALLAVGLLWIILLADMALPVLDLTRFGIRPRRISGLAGIFIAPFVHKNPAHLVANTLPLAVLLAVALFMDQKKAVFSLVVIVILGGFLVWLFGTSNSVHIGASGVIFGLIGYLMFAGIFHKNWMAILTSIGVSFFYGGALWSLFHTAKGVSWSGHFFGFAAGVAAAWWTRKKGKRA